MNLKIMFRSGRFVTGLIFVLIVLGYAIFIP